MQLILNFDDELRKSCSNYKPDMFKIVKNMYQKLKSH